MKSELLGMGLSTLVLLVIFSSGCVLESYSRGDDVEGIDVDLDPWKEDNFYLGIKIRVSFGNGAGDSIKVIDNVNLKIIYEKDAPEEINVYDKMIEVKEESYEYTGVEYVCELYILLSNFFKDNGNYTGIIEYKGISASGRENIVLKIDVDASEEENKDLEVGINLKSYLDDVNITGYVNVSVYNESDELTYSEIINFSNDCEEIIYIDESEYYTGEGNYTVTAKYEEVIGEDIIYIE